MHFVHCLADFFAKRKSAVFSTSCRENLGFISSKAFIFDAESIYVGLVPIHLILPDKPYFDTVYCEWRSCCITLYTYDTVVAMWDFKAKVFPSVSLQPITLQKTRYHRKALQKCYQKLLLPKMQKSLNFSKFVAF